MSWPIGGITLRVEYLRFMESWLLYGIDETAIWALLRSLLQVKLISESTGLSYLMFMFLILISIILFPLLFLMKIQLYCERMATSFFLSFSQKFDSIVEKRNVWGIQWLGRMSHLSLLRKISRGLATWSLALSCCTNAFPYLSSYYNCFSSTARLNWTVEIDEDVIWLKVKAIRTTNFICYFDFWLWSKKRLRILRCN